jgi:SMODS-associating 4TM effector domain
MMNTIPSAQLESVQLARLAAQKYLYSKAKRMQGWELVLSVPCVIVWSFAVLAVPGLRVYEALWGIVVTIISSVVLDRWQDTLKERAAKIQEQFDCDVLQIEWPDLKAGARPDAELVADQAARYRRSDPECTVLRDWYAPVVGSLPIHLARLVCQRSSCWWDANLRRRYAVWVLVTLGIFSALVITLGLLKGATLGDFVLAGIMPLMPAITLAIRQFYEHNDAAARADKLKACAEKLWDEALRQTLSPEGITMRSRQLQDGIFEHRRHSPLIFDWIYNRLRNHDEDLMNKGAEALVEEAGLVRRQIGLSDLWQPRSGLGSTN